MTSVKRNLINMLNQMSNKSNPYEAEVLIEYLSRDTNNLRIATKAIRRFEERQKSFATVKLPDQIDGFEDLTCLFHSDSQANFGVIFQNLDNAAYIYKLAKKLNHPNIVEIGRHRGGTTFLFASATDAEAKITSIDLFVHQGNGGGDTNSDQELMQALNKYGWNQKVNLVIGDSRTFECEPNSLDLILIDGDHSYAGVKADFLNFYAAIKSGGHILFDDSAPTRFGSYSPDVAQFLEELQQDSSTPVELIGVAGSLSHYQKV